MAWRRLLRSTALPEHELRAVINVVMGLVRPVIEDKDSMVHVGSRATSVASLSGEASASPQIAFRVSPAVRDKAAAVASAEHKTISDLAREALERYLAEHPGAQRPHVKARARLRQNNAPRRGKLAAIMEIWPEWASMKRKPNKFLLALIGMAHLGITAWTWRDIQRRPADQIRGSKTFWRTVSALNSGNSAIYWLAGRRRQRHG